MKFKIQNELALRDRVIKGLEIELQIKDELIIEQKKMIQLLEDNNKELNKLMDRKNLTVNWNLHAVRTTRICFFPCSVKVQTQS